MRSSHPLNVFKDADPVKKPWFVGRMPSASGGRVLDFAAGYTPDGQARMNSEDRGLIRDSDDNFFYLHVFGSTISMSESDMHECIAAMTETRQEKAKKNPRPLPDWKKTQQLVADIKEAVGDAVVGRTKFAMYQPDPRRERRGTVLIGDK